PTPDQLAEAIEAVGRELLGLGVVACHDPGGVAPDPDLSYSYPIYARLPDGLARVGWQKCFADGSLGSRTAALLEDIEPEPDRPLPPEQRRGVWMTDPAGLRARVARASAGGITSQIHAIGDAAIREV